MTGESELRVAPPLLRRASAGDVAAEAGVEDAGSTDGLLLPSLHGTGSGVVAVTAPDVVAGAAAGAVAGAVAGAAAGAGSAPVAVAHAASARTSSLVRCK